MLTGRNGKICFLVLLPNISRKKISKDAPLLCGSTAKLNIFFKRKTVAEERPNRNRAPESSLWEKYRDLRHKTKSIIYVKRKKFPESLPALLRTKKFWSIFKSVSKHSNIPNKMSWSHPDDVTSSAKNPADIANLLNHYLYSVSKHSDDETSLETTRTLILQNVPSLASP